MSKANSTAACSRDPSYLLLTDLQDQTLTRIVVSLRLATTTVLHPAKARQRSEQQRVRVGAAVRAALLSCFFVCVLLEALEVRLVLDDLDETLSRRDAINIHAR